MGLKITCDFDSRELDVFLNATSQRAMKRVVAKSLNRTGVTIRKEATQRIRKTLKLPARDIKEAIQIQRKARPTEPIDSQEVAIAASKKGISLRKFKPKQVASGVQVNITGRRQVVRHAFIASMPNASKASVFRRVRVRKGVALRRGKRGSELPIEKLAYKGISKLLSEREKELTRVGHEKFRKEFWSNYDHFIRSKGR